MPPKKTTKTGESQEKCTSFTWSEEDLGLLLNAIQHYKAGKEVRGFDWQSVKMKYDDLRNLFLRKISQQRNITKHKTVQQWFGQNCD